MESMKAFDVRLNGKRLCVAGIGVDGYLGAKIDRLVGRQRNELYLEVGGFLSPTLEHVTWKHRSLKVGDKVEVRIIEAGAVDRPKERLPVDQKANERHEKMYARTLAKKYGWKIIARPKN